MWIKDENLKQDVKELLMQLKDTAYDADDLLHEFRPSQPGSQHLEAVSIDHISAKDLSFLQHRGERDLNKKRLAEAKTSSPQIAAASSGVIEEASRDTMTNNASGRGFGASEHRLGSAHPLLFFAGLLLALLLCCLQQTLSAVAGQGGKHSPTTFSIAVSSPSANSGCNDGVFLA
ncbi:hypothetical protein C4D60_Mb06t35930 [Musa balbisiana]|uniref:Rx N-terminal domain-containing protein n=1 Tax=Musa balbisiana TaxID=52838 RepID=A0A4S8ITX1_MUSBA|nr:hypothetical protein C4D60_Mb06t35930 [Musa balbisiana]